MTLAALLLPFALAQAATDAPAHGAAHAMLSTGGEAHFEQCVASIDRDPNAAYEDGMAWSAVTHDVGGYRCAAMALIAENRYDEGAHRLETLASSVSTEAIGLRAELLSQAGNAWLLAHDPSQARSAFTLAITTLHSAPQQTPDVLIDRARAYAMEEDYRHAEEDLSHALDIRPNDALALRLRASARMHQNSFELAQADAQAAVNLEPTNVDSLLMLGHTREAVRTGHAVDEQ